ncbi:hypothetical protein Hanom_Chr07g00597041 [Helianthus anomalus]
MFQLYKLVANCHLLRTLTLTRFDPKLHVTRLFAPGALSSRDARLINQNSYRLVHS